MSWLSPSVEWDEAAKSAFNGTCTVLTILNPTVADGTFGSVCQEMAEKRRTLDAECRVVVSTAVGMNCMADFFVP